MLFLHTSNLLHSGWLFVVVQLVLSILVILIRVHIRFIQLRRFVCRTLKAMATNDKDRLDIVRHAASQSDPMYQNFRDTGYFLGMSTGWNFVIPLLKFSSKSVSKYIRKVLNIVHMKCLCSTVILFGQLISVCK